MRIGWCWCGVSVAMEVTGPCLAATGGALEHSSQRKMEPLPAVAVAAHQPSPLPRTVPPPPTGEYNK